MSSWLSRIRESLAKPEADEVDVRAALTAAQRSRARVELVPVKSAVDLKRPLSTTIESVGEKGIVITQPVVGGAIRPVARFETYRMSFTTGQGRLSGETRVLGRSKINAGGERVLYGYRLAIPEHLEVKHQRRDRRFLLGGDGVPEAQLIVFSHQVPIVGVVENISPIGARMLCRNAGTALSIGQNGYFKLELPEPVGSLREMANIIGLEATERDGHVRVRLAFDKRNERLAKALDMRRSPFTRRRRQSA